MELSAEVSVASTSKMNDQIRISVITTRETASIRPMAKIISRRCHQGILAADQTFLASKTYIPGSQSTYRDIITGNQPGAESFVERVASCEQPNWLVL